MAYIASNTSRYLKCQSQATVRWLFRFIALLSLLLVGLPAYTFECLETGTNSPWSATARKPLYTKLAGTPFAFDVVALNADGTIDTRFFTQGGTDKAVTVELVGGSGTTSCASRTAISPAVSQIMNFDKQDDAGRKTSAPMTVAKAYANLRCRVTYANQSPSVVACSTDNFAVRPQDFAVSSSNANADGTGASTTASPTIKAGVSFSLSADTATVGYNGTPVLDTSKVAAHSGAITNGVLSGAFGSADAATGIATGSSFAYSEVGYFRLGVVSLTDSSFTAVDQPNDCTNDAPNDFSNTLIGGKYGCKFGNAAATSYFGRFIPDHFTTVLTQACVAGGFTYSSQPFTVKATALTLGGGTTLNYSGAPWAKAVTLSEIVAISGTLTNGTVTASEFLSGVATHTTTTHAFATLKTVPAAAFLRATDTDSVSSNGFAEGTLVLRSGLLQLGSTYGSELLRLVMPLESQYWKEGGNAAITTDDFWTTNTADSCTVIPGAGITLSNYRGNLAAGETVVTIGGTFAAGRGSLSLSAPGANNNGSVDVTINNATAGVPWFGNVNEVARGTFGLRKTPIIYMRENF